MKKKIVSAIGIICLIVLVVGFYLWMDEETTKLHFKTVEESKPITIYLKEHAETGIIKSYDNYVKSIDDVEYIAYSETIPYFIINLDEGYNIIFASAYLSDKCEWKDMELRSVGKGQYIMDIIKTEKGEDRTITCCIRSNSEEGVMETYFSYKAKEQEEGIIVPFM